MRLLLWLLPVAVVVVVIVLSFQLENNQLHDNKPEKAIQEPHSKAQHEISGFRYNGIVKGKKVISISAADFVIQKKKIGFFRFGLFKEVRLKNAVVTIYRKHQGEKNISNDSQNRDLKFDKPEISGIKNKVPDFTFNNLFLKESLPRFPVKRISQIIMEPVQFLLNDGKENLTEISASSATIRIKQRDIFFKGDIRAISGLKTLTTDQLSMQPEKAVLKTKGDFILKTGSKVKKGRRLTTDIYLQPIK